MPYSKGLTRLFVCYRSIFFVCVFESYYSQLIRNTRNQNSFYFRRTYRSFETSFIEFPNKEPIKNDTFCWGGFKENMREIHTRIYFEDSTENYEGKKHTIQFTKINSYLLFQYFTITQSYKHVQMFKKLRQICRIIQENTRLFYLLLRSMHSEHPNKRGCTFLKKSTLLLTIFHLISNRRKIPLCSFIA